MQAGQASHLRFVVVGSGRSGTAYASALFSSIGMPCGHEAVFGWGPRPAMELVGDASFCAVPFLDAFSGIVFHQVRHPLDVLSSVVATRFFADPGAFLPHHALIEKTLPELGRLQDPLSRAMFFVVRWNELCEPFAHMRWQVENLEPRTLREAARRVGFDRSLDECASALSAVSRDVNRLETRGLQRIVLHWDDLPESGGKDALQQIAVRYGYGLELSGTGS